MTRLIPDAKGTTCNQRLERISGTEYTHILRVPFRNQHGILRKWISRFDVWPYLETFAEVKSVLETKFQVISSLHFGNASKITVFPGWSSPYPTLAHGTTHC